MWLNTGAANFLLPSTEESTMPIRKIPKNYMTVTGLATSAKSEEPIGYEGRPEFYFIKLATFNNNVAKCEGQPVTIFYHDSNGRNRTYTPDFRVTFKPHLLWKPLVVEVKPRGRLFKDLAKFRMKFRAARRHVMNIGEEFTIVTDKELLGHYLKNVLFLIKFRTYPIHADATELLIEAIKKLGETTPQALMAAVAADQNRRGELLPALWQLVSNFVIEVNLEKPLTMNSLISWPAKGGVTSNEIQTTSGCCHRKRWQALRFFRANG